jgi:hypothetical protein
LDVKATALLADFMHSRKTPIMGSSTLPVIDDYDGLDCKYRLLGITLSQPLTWTDGYENHGTWNRKGKLLFVEKSTFDKNCDGNLI